MAFLPPPTSNLLDQQQRSRFIKSARKLEALLGTTPRVLEAEEPRSSSDSLSSWSDLSLSRPSSRASRRSGHIYGSNNGSVFSLASAHSSYDTDLTSPESSPTEPPKPHLAVCADLPPVITKTPKSSKAKKFFEPSLFLKIHNVAPPCLDISPENSPDLKTAVPTTNVVPPSPMSPISPAHESSSDLSGGVDSRRKKLAKLTRTLGENIPPELVFSQLSGPPKPRHHLRSSSHQEGRRSEDSKSTAVERTPSKVYHTVNIHIPDSRLAGTDYPFTHATVFGDGSGSATSSTSTLKGTISKGGSGLRRYASTRVGGKGWSGEWNQDIDDVRTMLRNLK